MMTILAARGSCAKPGARYFDDAGAFGCGGACAKTGLAPTVSANTIEARTDARARARRGETLL
jgi:hypothetical protein